MTLHIAIINVVTLSLNRMGFIKFKLSLRISISTQRISAGFKACNILNSRPVNLVSLQNIVNWTFLNLNNTKFCTWKLLWMFFYGFITVVKSCLTTFCPVSHQFSSTSYTNNKCYVIKGCLQLSNIQFAIKLSYWKICKPQNTLNLYLHHWHNDHFHTNSSHTLLDGYTTCQAAISLESCFIDLQTLID